MASGRREPRRPLSDVRLGDRLGYLPSERPAASSSVTIVRSLVREPPALLADEPTGNLDEDARDEIITLLEVLWQELGLTLVLVTHDTALTWPSRRRLRATRTGPGCGLGTR
jgi:putative ABC transport system ATP-binding protein